MWLFSYPLNKTSQGCVNLQHLEIIVGYSKCTNWSPSVVKYQIIWLLQGNLQGDYMEISTKWKILQERVKYLKITWECTLSSPPATGYQKHINLNKQSKWSKNCSLVRKWSFRRDARVETTVNKHWRTLFVSKTFTCTLKTVRSRNSFEAQWRDVHEVIIQFLYENASL